MHSNRPYLLRAFYQWIVDNGCTPILVIDANYPHCKIPRDYVEGGEIVFNISSAAVRDLKIANDLIEFKASFSGVIHLISVPNAGVLALYAEENGEGIFLDADDEDGGGADSEEAHQVRSLNVLTKDDSRQTEINANASKGVEKGKPVLRLVE